MKALVAIARMGNRHQGELLVFFVAMMSNDMVAPAQAPTLWRHILRSLRQLNDIPRTTHWITQRKFRLPNATTESNRDVDPDA